MLDQNALHQPELPSFHFNYRTAGGAEFAVRFTRAGTRSSCTAPVGTFHGTVEVDGLYTLVNLETASSRTVWVQCRGGPIGCSSDSRRKTLSSATTTISRSCVQCALGFPGKGALDSATRGLQCIEHAAPTRCEFITPTRFRTIPDSCFGRRPATTSVRWNPRVSEGQLSNRCTSIPGRSRVMSFRGHDLMSEASMCCTTCSVPSSVHPRTLEFVEEATK